MTNIEKAAEIGKLNAISYTESNGIAIKYLSSQNECNKSALEMAKWKDQQFKEYLDENLSDIVFECIEEYKKIKGNINDDGTLRSDYQLAQDIAITSETKIISELFKEK